MIALNPWAELPVVAAIWLAAIGALDLLGLWRGYWLDALPLVACGYVWFVYRVQRMSERPYHLLYPYLFVPNGSLASLFTNSPTKIELFIWMFLMAVGINALFGKSSWGTWVGAFIGAVGSFVSSLLEKALSQQLAAQDEEEPVSQDEEEPVSQDEEEPVSQDEEEPVSEDVDIPL